MAQTKAKANGSSKAGPVVRRTKRTRRKWKHPTRLSVVTELSTCVALDGAIEARVGNHDDMNSVLNEAIDLFIAKYQLKVVPLDEHSEPMRKEGARA